MFGLFSEMYHISCYIVCMLSFYQLFLAKKDMISMFIDKFVFSWFVVVVVIVLNAHMPMMIKPVKMHELM